MAADLEHSFLFRKVDVAGSTCCIIKRQMGLF